MVSLSLKILSNLLFKYPTRIAKTTQCEFNQILNILEPNIQIPKLFKLIKLCRYNVIAIQQFHWVQRFWYRFTAHVPRSFVKTQNMKVKVLYFQTWKFSMFFFKKNQNNVNRIDLYWLHWFHWDPRYDYNYGPTELKTYWIWSNSRHSIKCEHLPISFLLAVINIWYTPFSV